MTELRPEMILPGSLEHGKSWPLGLLLAFVCAILLHTCGVQVHFPQAPDTPCSTDPVPNTSLLGLQVHGLLLRGHPQTECRNSQNMSKVLRYVNKRTHFGLFGAAGLRDMIATTQRVQVPNIKGPWSQKPLRVWYLEPDTSSIGHLDPLGTKQHMDQLPLRSSETSNIGYLDPMGKFCQIPSPSPAVASEGPPSAMPLQPWPTLLRRSLRGVVYNGHITSTELLNPSHTHGPHNVNPVLTIHMSSPFKKS